MRKLKTFHQNKIKTGDQLSSADVNRAMQIIYAVSERLDIDNIEYSESIIKTVMLVF